MEETQLMSSKQKLQRGLGLSPSAEARCPGSLLTPDRDASVLTVPPAPRSAPELQAAASVSLQDTPRQQEPSFLLRAPNVIYCAILYAAVSSPAINSASNLRLGEVFLRLATTA